LSYHGTNYTLTDRGTFTYDARINHTPINARPGVVLAGRHAGPLHAVARSVRNRKVLE
jgi:hypothetical protein